ncbi:hypothetical protein OAO01_00090 [Oligoflexia bacterium]|nr:hypothetical protein [Oligoflexia bacterium]
MRIFVTIILVIAPFFSSFVTADETGFEPKVLGINKVLPASRWIYLDGQYEGTLALKRIKQRGVPNCSGSSSFYYNFVVNTYSKSTSVYLENGTELTGLRRKKSFRTVLDTGNYTYRVKAKRCRGTACFFTFAITEWSSGSNYCKGTWKGWMYADN